MRFVADFMELLTRAGVAERTEDGFVVPLRRRETEAKPTEGPRAVDLANIWNELKHQSQPRVIVTSVAKGKRYASATNRLKEQGDLDFWRTVVRRIAASPFCQGHNERKWKADFDFLIQPNTYAKVLEGKYDGQVQPARSHPKPSEILQPLDRPRSY